MIDNGAIPKPLLAQCEADAPDDFGADLCMDDYEFTPWANKILVRRFPPEMKTRGGLHLPDRAMRQKSWGEVLKVGEGVKGVSPGDILIWHEGAGIPLEALGRDAVLLDHYEQNESDILGKLALRVPKAQN